MNLLIKIKEILHNSISRSPEKAAIYFKTEVGFYAEKDTFIGVTNPNLRKIAKNFMYLDTDNLELLLKSNINEERFLALIILTKQYQHNKQEEEKRKLYEFYIKNLQYVDNWNLVDTSAHLIIGAYLWDKDRSLLIKLATSKILWHRRIAIISTLSFIRKNDLPSTFEIASILVQDREDLIHKAVGWMLREAGKRNQEKLITFLDQHLHLMPRTMLRYAIEKFSDNLRKSYLIKKILKN